MIAWGTLAAFRRREECREIEAVIVEAEAGMKRARQAGDEGTYLRLALVHACLMRAAGRKRWEGKR